MSESFFSRWSRQKRATAESLPTPTAPEPARDADPPVSGQVPVPTAVSNASPPALAPALPSESTALPTLDDVKALTPESDFQPFMQCGVGGDVRNAAMKKLFADPHFHVMDGLDIYIGDYSQPDPLPAGMLRKMAGAQFLRLAPEESSAQAPASVLQAPEAPESGPMPTGGTEVVAQSPDSSVCADTPAHDHLDLQLQPDAAPAHPQSRPGSR